ncbi:MAG: FAD-dependent monooxygenase [Alphaproteobacteria bacterium]|jgi:3-(3-hydroxy-phenyl)propionate hydroxylase|nr:FAD-dependent monooxygenase [Alphaproteobacteria bacterium]MBT4082215.1 FAD-dependent monooxygenase [Alphaproteobacteria bacterium]MBT4544994.1 FAD-dependent monooxygenase [Alphaproteobacteria bacterium]MBT7745777.1 FAD-dependent monooxygenase [Alphaproteobacteria bacterium]
MDINNHVIIAGAGPVGCTAALILAQAGVKVTLLESAASLIEDLRASTFHPPSLDMLDELGVTEKLLPQGLIASKYQYRDRTSGAYAEFDLGVLSDITKHPYRLQCEQYKLTRTIKPMLEETGNADIRFSTAVTSVTNHADHVEVTIDGPEGKDTLSGRYLIGSDGARSEVRKEMNIEMEGFTYPELFLVVSTDFPFEDHLPNLSHVNYISDSEEWCTILRVPGFWRVLFPTIEGTSEDELLAPDKIEERMQRLVKSDAPYNIVHTTLYNIHQRVAKQYRVGNVLIAGDAAHLNNPLGGMGMNGGLHDVFNLCPKMIDIIQNGASEDLLDLYERQRRDVTIDFIQSQTIQNKKNIEQMTQEQRLEHIDGLNKMIADPALAAAFLSRNNMFDALKRAAEIT